MNFQYNSSPLIGVMLMLLSFSGPLHTAEDRREAPQRLSQVPKIQIDWINSIDECTEGRVCIEGELLNEGGKPAYQVHLKVELGGTKYIKPKINLYAHVDSDVMAAGDRQQFYIELDRHIQYRHKGKLKILEVGKYTYKVIPQWDANRQVSTTNKKRWIN